MRRTVKTNNYRLTSQQNGDKTNEDETVRAQKLVRQSEERRNVQMVGVFMVIGVLGRLGARAAQAPDGVAGGYEPREAVTSHSRERYTRIVTPRSTSRTTVAAGTALTRPGTKG